MALFRSIFILMSVFWGFSLHAEPCLVSSPEDFSKQFENLSKGGCKTEEGSLLYFDHSMDIFQKGPLVLAGLDSPLSIEAKEGVTVRFIGWQGSSNEPALTIKRAGVSLFNLTWRDFPGSAIRVEGDQVTLKKIRLLHNGTRGASGLLLLGNDIQVIESEIAESGLNGILITDENWPSSCDITFPSHRARNILLLDNDIHHNGDFGVVVDGYQVQIRSSSPNRGQIHHNPDAGIFLKGHSAPSICNPEEAILDPLKFLHTVLVSQVSFYENGPSDSRLDIKTVGPVFPRPEAFVGVVDEWGDLLVSGQIPLSKDPKDPWSLGLVSTQNLRVEIYASGIFLASIEKIFPEGQFQTKIPKKDLPSDEKLVLTSLVTDTLLKVSSPFSEPSTQGEELDSDDDGLTNAEEDLNRTDPKNPDTDGDGLKDGPEKQAGLDPTNPDTDGDGIKDGQEDKTDPKLRDTDQDGLNDGVELILKTDPTNADTDGDGAKDGLEVNRLHSDPKVCDTDQDGLGDGLEAGIVHPQAVTPECRGLQVAGTNFRKIKNLDPTDSDSDGDGLLDGEEDANHNGWLDFNETDPTLSDSDGDGLSDGLEKTLDKDQDGLIDFELSRLNNGEKCSPPPDKNDLDCDGLSNGRDEDSDNDGCLDSEEGLKNSDEDEILDLWEASVKACVVAKAPPTTPSQEPPPPSEAVQEKSLEEAVLPARGGGACQFLASHSFGKSWPLFVGIYLISILIRSLFGKKSRLTPKENPK